MKIVNGAISGGADTIYSEVCFLMAASVLAAANGNPISNYGSSVTKLTISSVGKRYYDSVPGTSTEGAIVTQLDCDYSILCAEACNNCTVKWVAMKDGASVDVVNGLPSGVLQDVGYVSVKRRSDATTCISRLKLYVKLKATSLNHLFACKATNQLGKDATSKGILPKFTIYIRSAVSTVSVNRGDNITIWCPSENDGDLPPDAAKSTPTFWFPPNDTSNIEYSYGRELQIWNATDANSGLYKCQLTGLPSANVGAAENRSFVYVKVNPPSLEPPFNFHQLPDRKCGEAVLALDKPTTFDTAVVSLELNCTDLPYIISFRATTEIPLSVQGGKCSARYQTPDGPSEYTESIDIHIQDCTATGIILLSDAGDEKRPTTEEAPPAFLLPTTLSVGIPFGLAFTAAFLVFLWHRRLPHQTADVAERMKKLETGQLEMKANQMEILETVENGSTPTPKLNKESSVPSQHKSDDLESDCETASNATCETNESFV
eukprot:m.307068 g.307068  ORF g.307068 m.307068 type:complete len:489 (+) comp41864_c0_seq1:92-1558(+)